MTPVPAPPKYQEPATQELPGREHYHRPPVLEPGLKTDETRGEYLVDDQERQMRIDCRKRSIFFMTAALERLKKELAELESEI